MDEDGGEFLVASRYLLPDIGDEDEIPRGGVEGRAVRQRKGQHPPVDAVGAVALGGEVVADIGAAPQYPLAGGGLLPGGAVAGLVGEDHRADVHTGQGALRQVQRRQHRLQRRHRRTGGAGCLQRLRSLGPRHIIRVTAGQGKLRQLQGVGAVGGCLAGGDQLIGGSDLVPQDGGHLHKKIVGQGGDSGPLGNIGAVFQGCVRLRPAETEVDPAVVHRTIEPALYRCGRRVVHIGGRG